MIPFGASLDDLDFDALVEIGRGGLPLMAPGWTDYNYHDPGITLIDLLAWIADTQVYSLARNRLDERLAMAALLGVKRRGARAAQGVLYLDEAPQADFIVKAGTRLVALGGSAPQVEVAHEIDVVPLELEAVIGEQPGGKTDHSAANRQARASYAPFGEPPSPNAALVLKLAGALPARRLSLSLGIEIPDGGPDPSETVLGADLALFYRGEGGRETRLKCALDSSAALQRSGAIVAVLPAGVAPAGAARHRIVLRLEARQAVMPRLLRIAPNALPVVQQARFRDDALEGSGRPGQCIAIDPRSKFAPGEAGDRTWRLRDGEPDLVVQVAEGAALVEWPRGKPEEAGPGDKVYALAEKADGSEIAIRFGNGVNGAKLAAGRSVAVELVLSCGAGGNVMSRLDWRLAGRPEDWHNRQPIRGGRDAPGAADLLAEARQKLRAERSFAASRDIAAAARALPGAFGVDRGRIAVEEGWEPGRQRPAVAATRTLIVGRREGTETDAWRRDVARELAPRVPLGERLVVASPRYRRFRLRARLVARVGLRPDDVAKAVRAELSSRLGRDGSKAAAWPLGRSVTATAIGGWIRRVAGVAQVGPIELLDEDGAPLGVDNVAVGRGELPLLIAVPEDLTAEPGSAP
jgi:hypothetical protein